MFSKRLKELRLSKSLLQEDIGNYLGISSQSVSKWENGLSEPDIETQKKLADYFNVSLDYLLGREYKDEEYQELHNQVFNNPDLKIFFDKTKDLSKEDLKWVLALVEKVQEEHDRNN